MAMMTSQILKVVDLIKTQKSNPSNEKVHSLDINNGYI